MASEIEPNGLFSNSTSLTSDTLMEGSLSSSSDVDVYKISSSALATASYVGFSFDSPLSSPLTSAYKLTVLDGTGTATSTTASSGSDINLTYTLGASNANRPLYLKVDANSSSESVGNTYKLKYTSQSISENTQDNVVDSNNSTSKADALIPGVNFYGKLNSSTDVDLFSFTSGSSGTVTLDFTGFSSSQASNFYTAKVTSVSGATRTTVTNLSGESMSVTPNGAATATQVSFTATAQKTYFVEVGLTDSISYDASLASNDYTLLVSGTTNFNDEPVITMGNETSSVSGTSRSSGLSTAVAKVSSTSLSSLFSAADPDSSDTVTHYYVKLSYVGSNNGGTITNGPTTIAADDGSGGYSTITAAQLSSASYNGGSSGGTQTLKVWAKDSSAATDNSGYSGIISRSLITTDASASATVNSGSDTDIVEGSTSDYALVDLALSPGTGAAHTANIIMGFSPDSDITVKNSAGSAVISAVTFAAGETSKQVRVYALNDAAAEGSHTGTLGFTVTPSDKTNDAAYNNLQVSNMNFGISEDIATFTTTALTYSSGAVKLTEGNSATASYNISLSATPSNTVTVTLNAGADITLSESELTFSTSASGSDLIKTITASVIDDTVVDEGTETFVISHTVSESGVAASLLSIGNVSVSIGDNDSTPVVTDNQSFTVSKALVSGTSFATVLAGDADNDSLTYAIVSGAAGLFAINGTTGGLSTSASIESSVGNYSLVVSASDGVLSDTSTVSVIVSSSTENVAPVVSSQTLTVSESSGLGTVLGTVSASDANGDVLSYSITSGNSGNIFSINSTSGAISLANIIDYESVIKYTLGVASSDGVLSHTGNMVFNVSDSNDNKPVFSIENSSSGYLELSSSIGTSIATVSASDTDAGDTLAYSITSGNTTGAVSINSQTGQLTTAKSFDSSATINFWDASSTAITNSAFSFLNLGAAASSTMDLTIQVSDGLNTSDTQFQLIFPTNFSGASVTSTGTGSLVFGNYGNGSTYKIYKTLLNSDVNSHVNLATDGQKLADYLSGKVTLTGAGLGAADYDGSDSVDLKDGVLLLADILSGNGSELVVVDSAGSSNITIDPGSSLTLHAVVRGDLDASYAAAL